MAFCDFCKRMIQLQWECFPSQNNTQMLSYWLTKLLVSVNISTTLKQQDKDCNTLKLTFTFLRRVQGKLWILKTTISQLIYYLHNTDLKNVFSIDYLFYAAVFLLLHMPARVPSKEAGSLMITIRSTTICYCWQQIEWEWHILLMANTQEDPETSFVQVWFKTKLTWPFLHCAFHCDDRKTNCRNTVFTLQSNPIRLHSHYYVFVLKQLPCGFVCTKPHT